MSDSISKTQRWLDLLSFLVGRRFPVDVGELMKNVPAYAEGWSAEDDTARATVRRMFERDKDELRELGIPLETVEYSINSGLEHVEGYQLQSRDFYLPYLRILATSHEEHAAPARTSRGTPTFSLSEDEAAAALDALHAVIERKAFPYQDAARAARRKLAFDLDPGVLGQTPIRWIDPPGSDALVETLDLLSDALLQRKRVRFSYYGIRRDERSDREIEPWGLLFQHSHWYLVGRDPARGEPEAGGERRVFRVARMEDVAISTSSSKKPDFETPGDFALDDLRGKEAWELGDEDPVDAHVRFRFPRSLWAERNDMGSLVRAEEDGTQVRAFSVLQPGPFLRWVLSFGGEARVLEPPDLVRACGEMAEKVAALYADGAAPPSGTPASGPPHSDAPGSSESTDG